MHALDPDTDRMWRTVLRFYAAQGRPPGNDELATTLRVSPGRTAALLGGLQQRDLVGLDPTSGSVTHAYPLAPDATGHQVLLGGRVLNALCAIDALGMAEMFDADAAVTAQCRSCGDTVTVSTAERGRVLRSVSPALSVVWYDFAYAGSAAASCCQHIAFFCSDKHLQDWLDGQQPTRVGARLTMPEALELGRAIFGPVMRAIERLAHNPRHP
ncbi:organomercurial lyase [Methylobacterium brachiatum]|uniref:organomercurial lyase n=1 Tax=Methylobacterium brachiatum TaxID=269660 RepID=UPI0013CEBF62|nr:organomercurial lyase [Methylobacterium brachiatum]